MRSGIGARIPRVVAGGQCRHFSGTRTLLIMKRISLYTGQGMHADEFSLLSRGADWEYDDGTPPPQTAMQAHYRKYGRRLVESIVEACAAVEEMADKNQLPLRPGTENLRRFDPQMPLFLPISEMIMDEKSTTAERYEIYGDRAPLYSPEAVGDQTEASMLAEEPRKTADVSKVKRRRRVMQVKRPTRFIVGPQAKPFVGTQKTENIIAKGTGL
eukprot:TRINITY_DN8613_c0_g1_i1.p1 TRINITY_DN8613_c0_g1~~TRINITY_DN8613_c0_g1_i1.p1  ORF type:complete len:214 (+),score=49.05 TRINITY_DN8613_c0_g1_i1:83-724(+)